MNQALYMLAGAAALAVAYGCYVGVRKVGDTVRALTQALKVVPGLMKASAEATAALNRFSGELEFLRTAMLGGNPDPNISRPGQTQFESQRAHSPLPTFPGAPPFTPVPDAKVEDTDIVDTSDAELLEQERLEEVRGMGFEAEPLENPPGVTRDV